MLNRKSVKSLRVGLINFSDSKGGAARAAFRLYKGLRSQNTQAEMLVLRKSLADEHVLTVQGHAGALMRRFGERIDKWPLQFYRSRDQSVFWSLNWFPFPIAEKMNSFELDIINMHWVGSSFMPIYAVQQLHAPIVWTLHDEWAFTGGCHYAYDCDGFKRMCGNCPQLRSGRSQDISRFMHTQKSRLWKNKHITVVSPSRWLANRARESSLFADSPTHVIPNGLDLSTYQPINRSLARQLLKLPDDKKLILFGAVSSTSDRRKGFYLLQAALQQLGSIWQDKAELVIFGATEPNEPPVLGLPARYIGHLHDDVSLVLAYSAADVFVAPSLSENLPNTIMEAMACGTPSVAFNVGGIPDLIDHKENGYLARPYEPEDLAMGITWVLEDDERWASLSTRTREKVELEFDIRSVAQRYIDVYQSLM